MHTLVCLSADHAYPEKLSAFYTWWLKVEFPKTVNLISLILLDEEADKLKSNQKTLVEKPLYHAE
jgi:hypothetical protein